MNNISMKTKLMLLIALPLIGLIILSVILNKEHFQTTKNLEKIEKITILSTKLSSMIHEIQKERGLSASFLGSKGVKFKDKVPQQ